MKKVIFIALTAAFSLLAVTDAGCRTRVAGERPKTLRVIDYNIADGMWYDQYNNYDRFVEWVKEQDPDILLMCEAATHWNEHKKTVPASVLPRYIPDSLGVVAARYGHPYTALGPYQDNYPVAVSSKRPIEVVQRIGEGMSHGAMHVRIDGVNYVLLHLWPHKYSKDDTTRKGIGGDTYRMQEIQRVLDATILNPKYAKEKHWVMTGDFNAGSPVDREYYGLRNYELHTHIRSIYPHDAVADLHPGEWIPSTVKGTLRIDIFYCTDRLFDGILRAEPIVDEFTRAASDHLPILVDMTLPKR